MKDRIKHQASTTETDVSARSDSLDVDTANIFERGLSALEIGRDHNPYVHDVGCWIFISCGDVEQTLTSSATLVAAFYSCSRYFAYSSISMNQINDVIDFTYPISYMK